MVDGHDRANMTLTAGVCNCMSYDDGTGYIQTNCNYDPLCEVDGLTFTQRVSVTDTDVGCTDEGGGMIIDAELHLEVRNWRSRRQGGH
jgi:hypothetical protein